MKIEKNHIVELDYEIYNSNNKLLDKMKGEPIKYLHGEYDDIFRKVEEALNNKKVGDEIDLTLNAEDAFGDINPELIQKESLARLAEDIGNDNVRVGMMLEASSPESDQILLYRITEIADDTVILDANPPLAGEKLRFKAKVIKISPASEEQKTFGSANLPHNHGENCGCDHD